MEKLIDLTLEQILREYEPQAKERDLMFQGHDSYDVFMSVPLEYFQYFHKHYNALITYSSIDEDIDRDKYYVISTKYINVK